MSNGIWTDSLRIPLIIAEPGRRAQGRRTGPGRGGTRPQSLCHIPGRACDAWHAPPATAGRCPLMPHSDPTGDMTQALTDGVR
ncbi:hypothetical protein SVIO_013930 [Streptomyces violaceusniger]|uniref:Uncharacterized protein n=1 Tax=Streptomyces violaceusniger TaxID=68280 RepID=A0A4D4KW25_STRVO|nr:hypothetical protein SVIO_013930 [Streptomyces violaceusniger]